MLFSETATFPQGASVEGLARPIIYEVNHSLEKLFPRELGGSVTTLPWSRLQTLEIELRFGTFMVLDRNTKDQLFASTPDPRFNNQQRGRGRGGVPVPPPRPVPSEAALAASVEAQTRLMQNPSSTQRWMAQVGGALVQPKVLQPRTFQAKMSVPTQALFDRAQIVVEEQFQKISSRFRQQQEQDIPIDLFFSKKTSNTCDYKMASNDTRIQVDLETKTLLQAVEKRKFSNVDFGIALSPVDCRVAMAFETPVVEKPKEEQQLQQKSENDDDATQSTKSTQEKFRAVILKRFFPEQNQLGEETEEEKKVRVDTRKKSRTSYNFTIFPTVNENENQDENENENSNNQAKMTQLFLGGIVVDITTVSMNDKYDTLELEFEWDLKRAISVLDFQQQHEPQLASFIKNIKSALMDFGKEESTNNSSFSFSEENQPGENIKDKMLKLRTEFLKFGCSCLVKSALGLAMSLKGDVGTSANREREE
jgi:hypothetical protein